MRGKTYQLRYVRCGKPQCHCMQTKGHGPYWYAAIHVEGKIKWRYLGLTPTTAFLPNG